LTLPRPRLRRAAAATVAGAAAASVLLTASAAEAATTTGFTKVCDSAKTSSETEVNGEWRKTSTTITAQHVVIVNTSGLDLHLTKVRLTDETTGKYVNGPAITVWPHRATKPWSPAKSFPRKHRIVLQVQGYMQDDHNDSFKCGARP
jgi:hypothetical protein